MVVQVLFLSLLFGLACNASANDKKPAEPPITLEPMVISADSLLSFGFSLRVVRQEPGDRLLTLSIERILEKSDADRKGLKSGYEIISINGREIQSYEATFRAGSELHQIFIGRPEGARVTLEVRPPGKTKTKKLTIVRKTIVIEHSTVKIGGLPSN